MYLPVLPYWVHVYRDGTGCSALSVCIRKLQFSLSLLWSFSETISTMRSKTVRLKNGSISQQTWCKMSIFIFRLNSQISLTAIHQHMKLGRVIEFGDTQNRHSINISFLENHEKQLWFFPVSLLSCTKLCTVVEFNDITPIYIICLVNNASSYHNKKQWKDAHLCNSHIKECYTWIKCQNLTI